MESSLSDRQSPVWAGRQHGTRPALIGLAALPLLAFPVLPIVALLLRLG